MPYQPDGGFNGADAADHRRGQDSLLGIESDNAKEIREALFLLGARQCVLLGPSEEAFLHVFRVRTVTERRSNP